MEDFFSRYKNPLVLMLVLFLQVIILASNVPRDNPRAPNSGQVSLIRVWAVNAITPVERVLVSSGRFFRRTWNGYVDLHDVRRQNQDLQEEVKRLRVEQVRYREAASETQRLQALLGFKERFISQTMAAQVIGSGGSEQSRVVYIDLGLHAGLRSDMAVITPDGVVGKVKEAFALSSQVLLITDRDSGAGVILSSSRLRGVVRGTSQGELVVDGIMADEKVAPGEQVITSGGERIYPKGIPVGTVISAQIDRDHPSPFLLIKVKPAADLARLEEVLVVTRIAEQSLPLPETGGPARAADILGERLPTVPKAVQPPAGSAQPDEKATPAAAVPSVSPAKKAPVPAYEAKTPASTTVKTKAGAGTVAGVVKKKAAPPSTLVTGASESGSSTVGKKPEGAAPDVTVPGSSSSRETTAPAGKPSVQGTKKGGKQPAGPKKPKAAPPVTAPPNNPAQKPDETKPEPPPRESPLP